MQILTEEEAAVYDRQIRLWGVEAQQRLRNAKILVVGLSSLGNEVCKNILLAGIHHMTMLDDTILSKEDFNYQFMTNDEKIGINKAEAYLPRCKELNPMVDIVIDKDSVTCKTDSFFSKYDLVCMTSGSGQDQLKINEICHRLGIKFICGGVFGFYGYIFSDLTSSHVYTEEKPKIVEAVIGNLKKENSECTDPDYEEKETSFCSLSEALSVPLFEGKSLRQAKQISKVYLVMRVMFEYHTKYKTYPTEIKSSHEIEQLLEVRNEVFEKLKIDNDLLSDDFPSLVSCILYPVNAVVGGVLSQEVIKAVSGRDAPHNNFFFYDAHATSGVVEYISPKNLTLNNR
uniref:SUMO-activating enzyme subunit 1 n=1 Tax=Hydra vulgaris TaxID=6087 RepID=T2M420_HYDVU